MAALDDRRGCSGCSANRITAEDRVQLGAAEELFKVDIAAERLLTDRRTIAKLTELAENHQEAKVLPVQWWIQSLRGLNIRRSPTILIPFWNG